MTALLDIRQALADQLATLDGLQVSATVLANPTPPCALVLPDDPVVEFDLAMQRGLDAWYLVVELLVGLAVDQGAQLVMDAFLAGSGSSSIKAAVEKDRTLGGLVADARVVRVDGYGQYPLRDVGQVLGCHIHVVIYCTG